MTQIESRIQTRVDDLVLSDFGFLNSFEDEQAVNTLSKQNSNNESKEPIVTNKVAHEGDNEPMTKVKRSQCKTRSDKNRLNWFWNEGKLQDCMNDFC